MARIVTSLVLSAVLLWAAVPARSYTYQFSGAAVQVRWTTSPIRISLSTSLSSPPSNIKAGSDALGAARRALRRWSEAANIQFIESSTGVDSVNPSQTPGDGISLITVSASATNDAFANEGGARRLGRTRVHFDSSGRIFESDIALNPRVAFSTDGTANTYDLESTFVHELGHLLGLDHSGVVGATMQPRQPLNFVDPAHTMRTLSDDDLAGIRSIYGQRIPFAVGSIAGQVNYGAGAHVWAENLYTGRVTGSSITKSDGSYRIDQLPTSDYRVFVEYLDEPVFAAEIAFPPSNSSHPYTGISAQPAFRATETQASVNVSAGNTTFVNPIITLGAPSINPRILGINGALQAGTVTLSAGRVYRLAIGGNNLAAVPLTASGFSVTSPFMTIDPASFARENPANYGFTDPNFGIVSFNVAVVDSAKFGDYTLRLRTAAGETAYLSGALALDPYTDFVESNPLENNGFFVRQQYLDFLFREPEQDGFDAWFGVLNRCDANPSPSCDRVTVSSAFFRSDEFLQVKGFFIYRFYAVAFGRRPNYAEMIPDLQFVTGQTAEEVNAKRDAYMNAFVQRPAFRAIYDQLSNAAYVDRLLSTAGVTVSNRDQLVSNLNTGAQTRAQVLRAVVESPAVESKEYNPAFVAMQYFGYLKRDPENEGFNAWLKYLNENSNDFRTMVNGFANSREYRTRFGQP